MKKLNVKKIKDLDNKVNMIIENVEMNKSTKMKELFDLGLEVQLISKLLDVRYNFVYNVISNYILINGIEVDSTKQGSKKDKVLELLNNNCSVKEICIELKCNMNYVYKIRKEFNESQVLDNNQEVVNQ